MHLINLWSFVLPIHYSSDIVHGWCSANYRAQSFCVTEGCNRRQFIHGCNTSTSTQNRLSLHCKTWSHGPVLDITHNSVKKLSDTDVRKVHLSSYRPTYNFVYICYIFYIRHSVILCLRVFETHCIPVALSPALVQILI